MNLLGIPGLGEHNKVRVSYVAQPTEEGISDLVFPIPPS